MRSLYFTIFSAFFLITLILLLLLVVVEVVVVVVEVEMVIAFKLAIYNYMTVPVAARSKDWVCCRSPSEIVCSNPTGRNGCLSVVSVVCCQVEVSATS